MSDEKKFIITGQDNGVYSTAKKIYSGIISDANKYTATIKEQNSYIDKQIKALEKKSQIEAKDAQARVKDLFSAASKSAPGLERQNAIYQAKEIAKEAEKKVQQDTKVIELLKGILGEEKKTTSLTEKAEKANQRKTLGSEEQYQSMKSLARQEVKENREGVRAKIKAAEKTDYAGMDPRSAEKLMYQKQLVGESKDKGIFGSVFAGTLAAGIVMQISQSLGKIINSSSGEQAVNSLIGGIPVVGNFLAAGGERHRQEQFEVQRKELELGARSGSKISGSMNLTSLGYSAKEALGLTEGLMGAAGNASGAGQTGNAAKLSRGFGLSPDTVIQIAKDIRTTHSHADIMEIASAVVAANPELKKDQTKFAEILSQTSQLTNTLASQTEHVNMKFNAGMVGALRSIGGSFTNPNTAGTQMQTINQSLANPQNDFAKARSFGVLSANNPGADYVQLMEDMEQGAGKQGYLSGTLKQIMKQTGGGRQSIIGIQQAFKGLSMSASEAMYNKFKKDPSMFDNLSAKGGVGDLEKMFGLTKRAEDSTQSLDKQKAEVDNAFLTSEAAGTLKIGSLTIDAAAKTFKAAVDIFSGLMGGLTGEATKASNAWGVGGYIPGSNHPWENQVAGQ